MPIIYVSLRKGTPVAFRKAIAQGIQRAMISTLKIPADDYFQVTHELEPENMIYDRNFFGVVRSDEAVFIQLFFNHRPGDLKKALFAAIADNLVRDPSIRREDIFMSIAETAFENWWAQGRTVNPETGTDSRMGS
jgi:4-oxalocrotonate tautomerase